MLTATADVLPVWSIAASGWGAPELFLTVSVVCDRRNEREHPAKRSAAASGAGTKLASLSSGAGGAVRKLGA